MFARFNKFNMFNRLFDNKFTPTLRCGWRLGSIDQVLAPDLEQFLVVVRHQIVQDDYD